MKQFSNLRSEAYGDMVARKQKLLNRSNDAYKQGDLGTMRKAHSLAMKQDSRTRAKYPDDSRKSTMSGATKDYADREKKYGPGKVRDSVEYSDDTNVVAEGKEELHTQLQSINQKLKLMRGGPVGEPNSMAFVEKRKELLKQKEQKLSQLKQGVAEDAVEEGILDFMSNAPAKPKSKLSLSAMRDIARRQDAKNKMPKVSRASNDSENTNAGFRIVRAEENENEEVEQVTEKFWDNEGEMIHSQLTGIIDKAQKICDTLKDNDNLEAWIQSEVTTASDAITCVFDHLMYSKDVKEDVIAEEKPGLYANIHAKQRRIKNGSGEHMRKPGSKGAPTAQAFKDSAKTAKEEVEHTDESRQVYYINSIKNKDPAVAQAKRLKNKMAKPPMLNSPRTTLKMGEAYSARNRLVMALDKEKKKREDHEAAQAAREAREAEAKTPQPQEKIKEGIASLISKNIKRVTATKPTPQQKADIRLNK